MSNKVSKADWIAMFKEIGLDDNAMQKWHTVFEKRHPQGHEDFMNWLGLSPDEIARVRQNCQ